MCFEFCYELLLAKAVLDRMLKNPVRATIQRLTPHFLKKETPTRTKHAGRVTSSSSGRNLMETLLM